MIIKRDFNPQSFTEFITDYVYIFHDDDVSTSTRKALKLKLFQGYVPRLYTSDLPLLLHEAKGHPLRSVVVIFHPNTQVTQADQDLYKIVDYKFMNDDDMMKLLTALDTSAAQQKLSLHKVLGQMSDVYAHRTKMRQTQIAQQYFEVGQLVNYLQPNDPVEDDQPPVTTISQDATTIGKQYVIAQQDCIKNTYYQNIVTTIKQQLNLCNSQQFAFAQQVVQVTVQDFRGAYGQRPLETMDLKVSVNCNFPLQFTSNQLLTYDIIQNQFPLCDDPTKPWFYVNDTRVTYANPLDSVPYGRLLMQGNSLKQPSCVLQDKQLVEGAEELAQFYQHFETALAKTCHALAQLYVSATKHSKRAVGIIQEEIKNIQKKNPTAEELGIQPNDFKTHVTKSTEDLVQEQVEDFLIQSTAALQIIRWDPKMLPQYKEYQQIVEQKIPFHLQTSEQQFITKLIYTLHQRQNQAQSRSWAMDYDEMVVLNRQSLSQSPVSLYTQEPTVRSPNDDVITIRPKYSQQSYLLYVGRTGRRRTTYETVCLLAQFLSLAAQVDPLPRRSLTHVLLFSERLALKNLFVPTEIADQAEQEFRQLGIVKRTQVADKIEADRSQNAAFYDLVLSKLRQISSRDKFQKVKVAEDPNAGDCGVCGSRFDSYKSHINSQEHIRNFRVMMLAGENMVIALMHQQSNFELIQAMNTQFNSIACTLAAELNCTWKQACQAINESIASIGGNYQLDTEDPPRANSPNCKTNSFARWREDVCLRRQGVLESVLTSSTARKSGYKRIKAVAASFAAAVVNAGKLRTETVCEYLRDLMCEVVKVECTKDKAKMNVVEREQFERQRAEQRLGAYNLKVVLQTDLLNYCYYKFPPEQQQLSNCFVRVKPLTGFQFQFNEEGHSLLMQIAELSLLLRAASGQPLVHDQLKLEDDQAQPDEVDIDEDAFVSDVVSRLTDNYPQLDGELYKLEAQKLLEQRRQLYGLKQVFKGELPLDVTKLDVKELRTELSELEIGHAPKSDSILRIALVIRSIQLGHRVTAVELYKSAMERAGRGEPMFPGLLTEHCVEKLKTLVKNFTSPDPSAKEGSEDVTNDQNTKLKLPQFDVFDPLVKKAAQRLSKIGGAVQPISLRFNQQVTAKVARTVAEADPTLLKQLVKQTAQMLDVPVMQVLNDSTVTPLNKQPDKLEPKQLNERSRSSFARLSGLTRTVRVVRSNSVGYKNYQLEPDQISMVLIAKCEEPGFGPRFRAGNLATVGQRAMCQRFCYDAATQKQYQTLAVQNSDPNAQAGRLICCNQQAVAAPLLSTNEQELFYTALREADVKLRQEQKQTNGLIPLLSSQLSATYAALCTTYGGYSDHVEATTQFWKAAADSILGTSAAVSTVTHDQPAYGLKTADIASAALVALGARTKLLREKAQYGKREEPLIITSKTVLRHIPAGAAAEVDAGDLVDEDVKVVENANLAQGAILDMAVLAVYNVNHGTE